MKKKKQTSKLFKVGDLVKLDPELFEIGNVMTLGQMAGAGLVSTSTMKHMFQESVQLSAYPPGFSDEPDRATGVMENTDVALILEFSDGSHLAAKVLTSHGWGWIPTAYLENT